MVWEDILQHHYKLNSMVGRQVKLLTSMCDYLLSVKIIKESNSRWTQAFEETNHHSKCDPMTGLYNRSYFTEALSGEISRSKDNTRNSAWFFLISTTLKINDQYGHLTGDTVLTRISSLIQKEKRAEDTAARFGGEEMIILLPETNKMNALIKADRIRQKLKNRNLNTKEKGSMLRSAVGLPRFHWMHRRVRNLLNVLTRPCTAPRQAEKPDWTLFAGQAPVHAHWLQWTH